MKRGLVGLRGVLIRASGIGADRSRKSAHLRPVQKGIPNGGETRPRAASSGDEGHQPWGTRRSSLDLATPPSSVPGGPFPATNVSGNCDSRRDNLEEFAAGDSRQRRSDGRGSPGVEFQSGAPHRDSAREIVGPSSLPSCPCDSHGL